MADDETIDQNEEIDDAAAADDWEAMLSSDSGEDDSSMADEWNSALEGEDDGTSDRTLNQDEIDSLLGFNVESEDDDGKTGVYALLDKALQSYQRLPLLEVVFDRFSRMLSSSLRNYTSDNVEVDIHSITSLRFEDYINSIPMPALLLIFKAIEWENYGIVTFDGSLVYSVVDVLFGGRKSTRPIRIEGRPYTAIEQNIVTQIGDIILADIGTAFDPISPTTFKFDRLETNPRFIAIARPSDAVILLQLRVDMEERGGNIEILIPYATLEPIRELLMQVFTGEKFGKDIVWESHFSQEITKSNIKLEAVFDKKVCKIKDIKDLKVGSTLLLDNEPDDELTIFCGGRAVLYGVLGRSEDKVAISVTRKARDTSAR